MTATHRPAPLAGAGVYTQTEVAALFGVASLTVGRWVRAGRIPQDKMFRAPSGRVRFDGEYIRSLLAGDNR